MMMLSRGRTGAAALVGLPWGSCGYGGERLHGRVLCKGAREGLKKLRDIIANLEWPKDTLAAGFATRGGKQVGEISWQGCWSK